MRLLYKLVAIAALVSTPLAGWAVNCTSQAELGSLDRDALTAVTGRLANAVLAQDYSALQAALLPEEASAWGGIRAAVEQGAPLVKGGSSKYAICICWTRPARPRRRMLNSSARTHRARSP